MPLRSLILASLFIASTGCGVFKSSDEDDDDDWDTAAWDTDGGGEETGGEETGGDETGGEETGGEETGGDSLDGSCTFSTDICLETNEADNEAWCNEYDGTPSADACPDDFDGTCVLPVDGVYYTEEAIAHYYNDYDGEAVCAEAGGVYAAADGGDDGPVDDGGADDGPTDDGGADDGPMDDGGADDGGADDADGGDDGGIRDSCSFPSICIEPNEPDNEAWCSGVGGTYAAEPCGDGWTGTCDLPAGGDYTGPATSYFYGSIEGAIVCETAGGTYTDRDDLWGL